MLPQSGRKPRSPSRRLEDAGFPDSVIASAAEAVVKCIKGKARGKVTTTKVKKQATVIPYVHRISHGFKRAASKYGVDVVFSARNKLSGICSAVEKRVNKGDMQKERPCGIKHRIEFVPCTVGTVYQIPFTCGKVYIGQTGRCLNLRLREHRSSLTGTASSHLALHCRDCACTPLLLSVSS